MRSIKNITLGLATVGVMFLSGCAGDYLDTIPSTSVSETTINTSLDNLYIALNGIHKEMVSQESGYQCLGGEPGFMMSRDAEADDMNWQTNTWMKAAYLGWQCNMNETNGYNYKFWQIYYQWILGNNQLMFAEMRNASEWAASTTFNNVWNSIYGNLQNIRQMQSKIENEVPGNVGQFDILGMAQVLEAVNFGVLTDMFGDIPYSEAVQGQGNLQPKLDAQKDVYTGILATLDKAIGNLEKGKSLTSAGNQDIAYKGVASKWLAAAHALKARYLLHKLAVEPNVLSEVATAVQKAIDN